MFPMLFNMVLDGVICNLSDSVGYELQGIRLNALAYADDIVLIASTRDGLQESINIVCERLASRGLELAAEKCAVLSLVPSGREKKMKVKEDTRILVGGRMVRRLAACETWRYLGVAFNSFGPVFGDIRVGDMLRVTVAPLKPQQRLRILKYYLLPRFMHGLVLGRVTYGRLRAVDRSVRAAVRGWMRLPRDVPLGYFYAAVEQGGFGIMALETRIPELVRSRLDSLACSPARVATAVVGSCWASQEALVWYGEAPHDWVECQAS